MGEILLEIMSEEYRKEYRENIVNWWKICMNS